MKLKGLWFDLWVSVVEVLYLVKVHDGYMQTLISALSALLAKKGFYTGLARNLHLVLVQVGSNYAKSGYMQKPG